MELATKKKSWAVMIKYDPAVTTLLQYIKSCSIILIGSKKEMEMDALRNWMM